MGHRLLSNIVRLCGNFQLKSFQHIPVQHKTVTGVVNAKNFSCSSVKRLKEIHETVEGETTIVEGIPKESKYKDRVLCIDNPNELCPLCPYKLNVDVKYTDVLILSQFMRADGCVLPRRVTGLCKRAQTRLLQLIHRAQRAGLMPELRPDLRNGKERTALRSGYKWRKYNIYYDDIIRKPRKWY